MRSTSNLWLRGTQDPEALRENPKLTTLLTFLTVAVVGVSWWLLFRGQTIAPQRVHYLVVGAIGSFIGLVPLARCFFLQRWRWGFVWLILYMVSAVYMLGALFVR